MAKKKKLEKVLKLQIPAGKANPAPPIGPALGSAGVNIMAFCKEYNAKTQDRSGDVLPVVINVYADKSFDFYTKEPPVPELLKKAAKIQKGSGVPNRDKVAKITMAEVDAVVEKKMADLRVNSQDAARKVIMGTARSMGIDVVTEGA